MIEQSLEAEHELEVAGCLSTSLRIVVRNFFGILSSLLLFLTPMLTMGVYSEERKRGTMETVDDLAGHRCADRAGQISRVQLTLLVIMLPPTFLYMAYMFLHSDPAAPWRILFSAYLGVILLGGVLLALGSFFLLAHGKPAHRRDSDFGAVFVSVGDRLLAQRDRRRVRQPCNIFRSFSTYDDFTRGVFDTSSLDFLR